jgi:hypothetical protein
MGLGNGLFAGEGFGLTADVMAGVETGMDTGSSGVLASIGGQGASFFLAGEGEEARRFVLLLVVMRPSVMPVVVTVYSPSLRTA